MNESTHRLLKSLWDRCQDSDSVFQSLIDLLNHLNRQLAATAGTILIGLCSNDPRPLITAAIGPGLSPAHRAKIIAVIGDIGQPIEMFDAVALVNHQRLQSKQAVTAVIGLFETLDAGSGILSDNATENRTRGGGWMLYALLKLRRPRSANRNAGGMARCSQDDRRTAGC